MNPNPKENILHTQFIVEQHLNEVQGKVNCMQGADYGLGRKPFDIEARFVTLCLWEMETKYDEVSGMVEDIDEMVDTICSSMALANDYKQRAALRQNLRLLQVIRSTFNKIAYYRCSYYDAGQHEAANS